MRAAITVRSLEVFVWHIHLVRPYRDRPASCAGLQLEDVGEYLRHSQVQPGRDLLFDFGAVIQGARQRWCLKKRYIIGCGDAAYLAGEGRASYERPYGLAWLLCLAEELHTWDDEDGQQWSKNLAPLEGEAANRLRVWLPKLYYPIRTGEHSQTASAFGLVLDWAETVEDKEMVTLIKGKALQFHLEDLDCPLEYEPSGQDFLSPCIAEADLMRRILPPRQFASWLDGFLPGIPTDGGAGWLPVGVVTDRADGKLAHLDGLNLSRAWMLEGIVAGLPRDDPRRTALQAAADTHREVGLAAVTGEHYEGGHWLASFATYLATGKGR